MLYESAQVYRGSGATFQHLTLELKSQLIERNMKTAHSGDWLQAVSVSACGTRLNEDSTGVAVGLRLGINICIPLTCPCGLLVDTTGSKCFMYILAFARMSRHRHHNDIVYWAFVSASIPVTKETVGLSRVDGMRPGGLTFIQWQTRRSLTWDVSGSHFGGIVPTHHTDYSRWSCRISRKQKDR